MAGIPVLWAHDHTRPIGRVEMIGDRFMFKFTDDVRVSEQALFEIFGDAGIRVTESEQLPDGTRLIRAGEILEFSLGNA